MIACDRQDRADDEENNTPISGPAREALIRNVDQKSVAAGLMYIAVGAAASLGALQYPLGSFQRMGPGFFPLMVGIGLIGVGAIVALIAVSPAAAAEGLGRWEWRNLALLTLAVVLFGLLLRPAGALVAIAVLVAIAARAGREMSFRATVGTAVVLVAMAWVIFIELIGLPLTLLPAWL